MSVDHPKIREDGEGNLLLNFGSYGAEVEVAAISGDGRRLLTVREVGTAIVWDASTGEQIASIRPDSPLRGTEGTSPFAGEFVVFIESAALSADGTIALLGLNDGTARIYRTTDREQLARLHPPNVEPGWGVVRSVSFSPDDSLALVGFPRRTVGVWSRDGSRQIAMLAPPAPDALVAVPFVRDTLMSSVAASPDGQRIFGGAVDMTACVFELSTGSVLLDARDHAEAVLALFDGPDGVGWATTGGTVWFATGEGEPVKVLDTHEHWSEAVFDGERVLVRAFDDSIALWSFEGTRTQLGDARPPEQRGRWASEATTLWLSKDEMIFPRGGHRVHLQRGTRSTVFDRAEHLVRVELSPKRDLIATDGWADELQLRDVRSGEIVHSLPCPGGSGCFAFSPDGSLVATGEIGHGGGLYDRTVFVYDTSSGERVHELSEHQWQIRQIAFSPEGDLLASVGDDLVVWDLSARASGKPLLRAPLDRVTGRIVFAGRHLVAVDEGRCQVFDRDRRLRVFEVPVGFETPWVLSEDGEHILVGGSQSAFRFSLVDGQLKRELVAEIPRPERVPTLALAKESEIRGGAMMWRVGVDAFLHQSDGPRGWVEPLQLSADGIVAVPCADGAAVLRVEHDRVVCIDTIPFEGKLRAGRQVGDEFLLLNETGRLFRARLDTI